MGLPLAGPRFVEAALRRQWRAQHKPALRFPLQFHVFGTSSASLMPPSPPPPPPVPGLDVAEERDFAGAPPAAEEPALGASEAAERAAAIPSLEDSLWQRSQDLQATDTRIAEVEAKVGGWGAPGGGGQQGLEPGTCADYCCLEGLCRQCGHMHAASRCLVSSDKSPVPTGTATAPWAASRARPAGGRAAGQAAGCGGGVQAGGRHRAGGHGGGGGGGAGRDGDDCGWAGAGRVLERAAPAILRLFPLVQAVEQAEERPPVLQTAGERWEAAVQSVLSPCPLRSPGLPAPLNQLRPHIPSPPSPARSLQGDGERAAQGD